MRIQRFIARDMRSALGQVRESLGPDAVILSSGKIGDEVEVVAAIDAEIAQAVAAAPTTRYEPPRVEAARTPPRPAPRAESNDKRRDAAARAVRRASSQLSETLAPAISAAQIAPPPPVAALSAGQEALASEMKDMRRMLESQLATL